ncbi:MAG: energy-coupling factor transporter transmembrane protein EcfT [Deltaproteobacteria bacterium]|nr:energy-coupling factor transporter transmembrane protein EcfT [Deltaproteobacteria bacterium]
MNLSLYRDEGTWLHRLDPRTKIVGALVIFAWCLCFNHPAPQVMIMASLVLIAFLSRSQGTFWTLRHLLVLLILFSSALWPFFVRGQNALWAWRSLQISRESLLFGIAMGLRLASFVMAGLLLLATTRNEEITGGLIRLGLPYPVAFALATALRLVPTFAGAGAAIVQAQVSRGLDLETKNLVARIGKFIPLAVPMFITAIRYTNFLAMALESRGFRPDRPRSFFYEPRMARLDWLVLVILFCLFGLFLYLRLGMGMGVIMPGRL